MEKEQDNGCWGAEWNSIGKNLKSDHRISESVLKQRALKRKIDNEKRLFILAKSLDDLCGEPSEGEQWRIVTEKQFNAFALVLHLLQTREIEEMYLAVYRINEPTVTTLIEMMESGRIRKATFVISSFFNQTKRPEKWAIMLKEYADRSPRCSHVYTHNHSKVLAVRTSRKEHFVFEGSGNMSDNARIEQYVYEQSRETYEFHRKWMSGLSAKAENGRKEKNRTHSSPIT